MRRLASIAGWLGPAWWLSIIILIAAFASGSTAP